MLRFAILEPLEHRSMLSTTFAYGVSNGYESFGTDVTSTWTEEGSTLNNATIGLQGAGNIGEGFIDSFAKSYTVAIDGLPAHSMVRVQVGWDDENGNSVLHMKIGGSEKTQGVWIASSDSSLEINFSATTVGSSVFGLDMYGVEVDVYKPKVTVHSPNLGQYATGVSEGDTGNHPFSVSRDIPSGYSSTGTDDAIPAVAVKLKAPSGSTDEGTDYNTMARSVTIAASKTVQSAEVAFHSISDDKPEGYGANFLEWTFLEADPDDSKYNTDPANAGRVDILEDLHPITYAQVIANADVQAAINTAWTASNPDGPTAGKLEQGFSVWYSLQTGQLSVIVTVRDPADQADRLSRPVAISDPSKVMVAVFHTHPFIGTDDPSGIWNQGANSHDNSLAINSGLIEFLKNHETGLVSYGADHLDVTG